MTAYPQVAEILLELISQVDVVVGTQHAQQQRLTKAARTDEEQVAAGELQLRDVHRLVNIIVVLTAHTLKVGDAKRQLHDRLIRVHISTFFTIHGQRYIKTSEMQKKLVFLFISECIVPSTAGQRYNLFSTVSFYTI